MTPNEKAAKYVEDIDAHFYKGPREEPKEENQLPTYFEWLMSRPTKKPR